MIASNRLVFGSIVAITALACGPGANAPDAPTITFDNDPRLGIVVIDRAAREPLSPARESIDLARVEVTNDGVTHLLLGLGPWRPFGEDAVEPGEVLYRAVLPDGRVEVRPSPPIGAPLLGDYATQGTPDGKLVVLQSGALAAGQLARILVYDGSKWIQHEFLRNDRVGGTAPKGAQVQVRALDAQTIVVQYDSGLSRLDDGKWIDIETPPGAKSLRLGPFDATGTRVFWLDARGTLHSRWLDRATWTLTGKESLFLAPGLNFGTVWNWSGTPDAFVLDLDAAQNSVVTARFARDGFRQLNASGGTPGLLMRASYDSLRAARVLTDGPGVHLQPLYQGAVSGPEVLLPRNAPVTCETACIDGETTEDGTPRVASRNPTCLQCFERTLLLWAVDLSHDGKTIHALYADDIQEGRRLYLKRLAWPQANDPFAGTPGAVPVTDTAYPGEPATVPEEPLPPEPALLTVRVLRVGRSDHSGSTVTITGNVPENAHLTQTFTTGRDGVVTFDPLTAGQYLLQARDDAYNVSRVLDVLPGEFSLPAVVLEATFTPTEVPPDATFIATGKWNDLFAKRGASLWQVSNDGGATRLRTEALTQGPRFFGEEGMAVWQAGTNIETIPSAALTSDVTLLAGFVDLAEVHPMGDGLAVPMAGYNSQNRPFQWVDAFLRRTNFFRDSVAVVGNRYCNGAWLWSATATTGLFEVNIQSTCDRPPNGTPINVVGTAVPRLFDHQLSSGNVGRTLSGFEEPSCGGLGTSLPACKLWKVGESTGDTRKLSDRAVAHAIGWNDVFWMERATDGTLSVRASSLDPAAAPLATGPALNVARDANEPWLVADGRDYTTGRRAYWRQTDGLWSADTNTGNGRNVVKLVENIVRMRETRKNLNGFMARYLAIDRANTNGAIDCSAGCTTVLVRIDTGEVTVGVPVNATENYVPVGDHWVTDGDVWNDCPGGPCHVLARNFQTNTTRVPFVRGTLAIGRSAPLVRLDTFLPTLKDGAIVFVARP